MKKLKLFTLLGLGAGCVLFSPTSVEAQTVISGGGNYISGTTFYLGTHSGSSSGFTLVYDDVGSDVVKFHSNRIGSWLWENPDGGSGSYPSMRLDQANNLILYNGSAEGMKLDPVNRRLTLGANANGTLTADANGVITAGGGFTVAGGITNTSGTLTGGATGLALTAGGTNQGITFSSSGAGDLVFNTNGLERVRITSGGLVGIATPSPSDKLHIKGTLAFSSANTSAWKIVPEAATNDRILQFQNNSSQGTGGFSFKATHSSFNAVRLKINNDGNVGIGTPAPGVALDVVGPHVASTGLARFTGTAAAGYVTADTLVAANASSGFLAKLGGTLIGQFHADSSNTVFVTNRIFGTTPSIAIPSNGNVGIGTTSPSAPLEIRRDTATAALGGKIVINNFAGASYASAALEMNATNVGGNDPQTRIQAMDNADWSANLLFLTKAPGSNSNTLVERMRIASGGNVGIGTTTPAGRLHVLESGTDNTTGDSISTGTYVTGPNRAFGTGSNPTNLTVMSNSTLGADVGGTVGLGGRYTGTQFAQWAILKGAKENATDGNLASYLAFGTRADGHQITEKMRISSAGNIGVGTNTPTAKLEISQINPAGWNGNLRALRIASPDGSYYMDVKTYIVGAGDVGYQFSPNGNSGFVVTTPGNVGIGTTNPGAYKLAVKGKIRAEEIVVDTGWADYVFEDDYRLAPLAEVESHIKAKKHLPGIPSAAEVAEHGVSMGEMQSKLLSKVEELTLHLIRMEKENAALRERVRALENVSVNR